MSDVVLLDRSDGIALITLNRPHKLNALSRTLVARLMAVLDAIELDASVRAVILTGAGERAFSAGVDLAEFSVGVGDGTAVRDIVRRGQALTSRLEAFPKPVIAAVNGLAYGGGCEITEAVHLAIASDRAVFGQREIRLAMPPSYGGTQRLPRLAGRKRGLELLLTGDDFSPQHALEIGVVNAVVPHDRLLQASRELAGRIIRHSPQAVAATIAAATRGLNMSIDEGLQVERAEFAAVAAGAELGNTLAAWSLRDRRGIGVA
jgi:enoyl-CoA hydratase/carnithine racemase